MLGASVCIVSLAGVDVVPFRSEKDSYSLFGVWRADPVTFFKEFAHYANLFYRARKILCVCWD